MARRTVLVSDLSGEEIGNGDGATLRIVYSDARRGEITLDVRADEIEEIASKGHQRKRRGRKPKVAA